MEKVVKGSDFILKLREELGESICIRPPDHPYPIVVSISPHIATSIPSVTGRSPSPRNIVGMDKNDFLWAFDRTDKIPQV